MFIDISSLDDQRLDPYRHLKQSNLTRWSGLFIAEGEKLTRRLLTSEFETVSVLLGRSYVAALAPLIRPETPVFVVADSDVATIVGFNFHRGVLACGRRRAGRAFDQIAPQEGESTLVVCPEVQDPENLGAILRIGSALGITALMFGRRCADPFSRRVLRVSMGAALQVPLIESDDLAADLRRLRSDFQYELVATVLDDDAQPLQRIEPARRVAILLGSEGHGLARSLVNLCDRKVTIPMQPGNDSLNVSVAAGIVLYHYLRVFDRG